MLLLKLAFVNKFQTGDFYMCPGRHHSDSGFNKRITVGIILIFLGALFLLNTLDVFSFEVTHVIFSFPFILFLVGILILVNSSKKVLGVILTSIGGIWLLPRIFHEIDYGGNIILPLVFIGLGIYIIFKHTQKKREDIRDFQRDATIDKDIIEDVAIFGGGTKIITSENFKGGSITAIFGGSEIDLTGCKMAEGNNIIDILALFGGTTLIIPKDWNVQINITPIFGGFSNKTVKLPTTSIDYTRMLVIKGLCVFGGGEIKSTY
jgi:predicted membrane protein